MATGRSVHIGVNACDPEHYDGWSGPLDACETDCDVMAEIAAAQGFDSTVLKTAAATRSAVVQAIQDAAESLVSGDMLIVSYAGHGGQLKDMDGDEEDLQDETWCLYDGQLLDDELSILWSRFAEGVRILLVSDSCHSGTMSKGVDVRSKAMAARNATAEAESGNTALRPRFMPRRPAINTFRANRDFYTELQLGLVSPRPAIRASVRLLSGCQDDQVSNETGNNGLFTYALREAWQAGTFQGNYDALYQAILEQMPENQRPNHMVIGAPDRDFDSQRPFTI